MRKISDAVKRIFESATTFEFDARWGTLEFIKIKLTKDVYGEMLKWLNEIYGHTMYDPNNPFYKTEINIEADFLKHNVFEVYPAYFTTNTDDDIIATFRVCDSNNKEKQCADQ